MRGKQTVMLLALLLTLVVLPLMTACGGDDETKTTTAAPTETVTPSAPKEPVTIKIGFMGDYTGPYAAISPPMHKGQEDYIYYVNEKIGMEGVELEFVWKDTEHKVPNIIASYEELKNEGCSVIFLISTTMTETLAGKINADKIPTISQGPTTAAIDPPGYMFLRYPFYPDMFGLFCDWYLEEWEGAEPPKFAILTTDFPLGKQMLLESITDYLDEKGVELVATELVPVVPVDTSPQLMRIRDAGADFCYGNNLPVTSAAILKDMTRLNLKESIDYGCPTTGAAEDLIKMGAEAAEGFLYTRAFAAYEETDNPTIKLINEIYQERHGESPAYEEFYLIGWNAASNMVEAIRLALEKVSPEELTPESVYENGFMRMRDFTPGVYGGGGWGEGPMNYAEYGNSGATMLRIARVTDGKIEILTDWRKAPNIGGLANY